MKIIHTSDLHIGQTLYSFYDRLDEHCAFFDQLTALCREQHPDCLLISGDIFDNAQPSAAARELYSRQMVNLFRSCPDMTVTVTAGNHDSASRLQAEHELWNCINVHVVGTKPQILSLPSGYVLAAPFFNGNKHDELQEMLDRIDAENTNRLPVVMMAHLAVDQADVTGHGEIGKMVTAAQDTLGSGYDYLALGHIHKPQTIGYLQQDDEFTNSVSRYPAGVARYSGSALHVSADETYPHSVSVVEIPQHGGEVTITRHRINELRHFYVLPESGAFSSEQDIMEAVDEFAKGDGGYFRLRIDKNTCLPSNFNQKIYDKIAGNNECRFNPKTIWEGEEPKQETRKEVFQVAELQQMTNPLDFIEKTFDQYSNLHLTMDELREAFVEVEKEMNRKSDN